MRPIAATAVSSANCVAVCSGDWHSADRYATMNTVPIAPVKFSARMVTISAQ